MTKRDEDAAYYQRNKERIKARANAYYHATKEARLAKQKEYYEANKPVILMRNIAYAAAHREQMTEYHLAYVKRNRPKWSAQTATYRAAKKQAAVGWANAFFVREAYALAALRAQVCGGEWQVDHTVPLNSPLVCGLHVENNLQVIPGKHNRVKSNKSWPDMP